MRTDLRLTAVLIIAAAPLLAAADAVAAATDTVAGILAREDVLREELAVSWQTVRRPLKGQAFHIGATNRVMQALYQRGAFETVPEREPVPPDLRTRSWSMDFTAGIRGDGFRLDYGRVRVPGSAMPPDPVTAYWDGEVWRMSGNALLAGADSYTMAAARRREKNEVGPLEAAGLRLFETFEAQFPQGATLGGALQTASANGMLTAARGVAPETGVAAIVLTGLLPIPGETTYRAAVRAYVDAADGATPLCIETGLAGPAADGADRTAWDASVSATRFEVLQGGVRLAMEGRLIRRRSEKVADADRPYAEWDVKWYDVEAVDFRTTAVSHREGLPASRFRFHFPAGVQVSDERAGTSFEVSRFSAIMHSTSTERWMAIGAGVVLLIGFVVVVVFMTVARRAARRDMPPDRPGT